MRSYFNSYGRCYGIFSVLYFGLPLHCHCKWSYRYCWLFFVWNLVTLQAVFLPLLIQGVGVDNAFLIIAPFSATNTADPIRVCGLLFCSLYTAFEYVWPAHFVSLFTFTETHGWNSLRSFCQHSCCCSHFYGEIGVIFDWFLLYYGSGITFQDCIPNWINLKSRCNWSFLYSGEQAFNIYFIKKYYSCHHWPTRLPFAYFSHISLCLLSSRLC